MNREDYPMPQLTAQEKEATCRRLLLRGANIKRRLAQFPNSEMLKLDLIGVQIALAALTSEPVAKLEIQDGEYGCFIAGEILDKSLEDHSRVLVYTTPPVPVAKDYGWISCNDRLPENKDGLYSKPVIALSDSGHVFTLSCQGGYWQRTEAFIKSGSTKVTHWHPLLLPNEE